MQRTLSIIKPDAVDQGNAGEIIAMIEKAGLKIIAMKKAHLTKEQAAGFYYVHKKRPFFKSLLKYITSGPVILMALEGENAIEIYRKLMGPTDSTKAPKNTIRGKFGTNIEANACHGSDSPESAAFEIPYFFNAFEFITPGRKA
ncbi:MAG: nucleoside-diphosphate kinase [Myxococcales bacterium]|nr:MAG: nucleoside-diphosphate kinase [Myxococcales bacterium]